MCYKVAQKQNLNGIQDETQSYVYLRSSSRGEYSLVWPGGQVAVQGAKRQTSEGKARLPNERGLLGFPRCT